MAFLLDFPQELFDQILDEYVATTPLPELFRARAVCRTFHRRIDHALFAETSAEVYRSTDRQAQPPISWLSGPRNFLQKNSYKFLLNQCKANRSTNIKYTTIIRNLVESLLVSAERQTGTPDIALRQKYLEDICRAVGFAGESTEYLLGKEVGKYQTEQDGVDLKFYREGSPITLGNDLLAAATAVGNRDVVHSLLARGASFWKTKNHLGCPIKLAAVNSQIRVLFDIMEAAKTRLNEPGLSTWVTLTPIKQAIEAAVDADAGASVYMLLEFLLTLRERTQIAPEYSKEALERMIAVRAASIGNARYVMPWLEESASKNSRAKHKENLKTVLSLACTAGQTKFVQKIIDVVPSCDDFCLDMSMLAAQHGHRALIDVFRGYGVVIGPRHFLKSLDGTVNLSKSADPSKTYFLIVQHMINTGVAVDVHTLKQCEMLATELFRNRNMSDSIKHISCTDKAMTIILVAHTAINHVERSVLKSQFYTKNFFKVLLNGRYKVPYAPLPFTELAREVIEWIESPQAV